MRTERLKSGEVSEADEALDFGYQRRWLLWACLAALVGAGLWLGWRWTHRVEPLRVLVDLDLEGRWSEGSKEAARLVDSLNQRLSRLGFEPVALTDERTMRLLEETPDARAAAKRLGAAWVVHGRIRTERIEHPIAGGYWELRSQGEVRVQHVDEAQAQVATIQGWAGGPQLEAAFSRLIDRTLAVELARVTLPALVLHPEIQERIGRDAQTVSQLQPARDFVAHQGRERRTFTAAYEALEGRRAQQERGAPAPTLPRGLGHQDGLCGAGPAGALVKTDDVQPWIDERTGKLGLSRQLESLLWLSPEGEEREIWRGYNLYGYPGGSADGRVVALSEDLFGWAKTVTVVREGQAPVRLRMDQQSRFSTLRPSPEGGLLSLYERACRECAAELVVLDTETGEERARIDGAGGRLRGVTWLSEQSLLMVYEPAPDGAGEGEDSAGEGEDGAGEGEDGAGEGEDGAGEGEDGAGEGEDSAGEGAQVARMTKRAPALRIPAQAPGLWRLDLGAEVAVQPLLSLPEDTYLSWPVAHSGGAVAFAASVAGRPALALWHREQPQLTLVPTSGVVEQPDLSPDGRRVVFSVGAGRAQEIHLCDVADCQPRRLTHNSVRDRYPRFSADGQRIWFETLDDDPNFPRQRTVVGVAVLPLEGAP